MSYVNRNTSTSEYLHCNHSPFWSFMAQEVARSEGEGCRHLEDYMNLKVRSFKLSPRRNYVTVRCLKCNHNFPRTASKIDRVFLTRYGF